MKNCASYSKGLRFRTASEYRVKRGDTLNSTSRAVYGDALRVRAIAKFNRLPFPYLILISQKLRLHASQSDHPTGKPVAIRAALFGFFTSLR